MASFKEMRTSRIRLLNAQEPPPTSAQVTHLSFGDLWAAPRRRTAAPRRVIEVQLSAR